MLSLVGVLVLLAWIGSLIDNLLLLYLIGMCFSAMLSLVCLLFVLSGISHRIYVQMVMSVQCYAVGIICIGSFT